MFRLLFCVVLGVARGQSQSMDELTRGLQDEMEDVWEQSAVNYSEPVINTTYRASVQFDMRAMGPLYNSTHLVIDVIANKQAYPEGFVSLNGGFLELKPLSEEWKPLLAHYAGPTAVIVVALLLVAILPLSGLFWCCCYWCSGGRRRRPFDRKYDACLKGLLAIVLIALLTLFLFGVVCLFATDSQVESGTQEAPESLRVGVSDTRAFLNATQAHARYLLVTNYRELSRTLEAVLSSSGMVVSTKLSVFSRAVSVTTLSHMVDKLDVVRADLLRVKDLTTRLRNNAEHLNSVLNKVKRNLLHTLKECSVPKCKSLQEKWNIGELATEIHYSQMPDVSRLLSNVTALLDSNIKEEVAAGQKVFRNIQRDVRLSVQRDIPAVNKALDDIGKKLEEMADKITWRAGNASEALAREAQHADDLQALLAEYGPYRRHAGRAAAAAPLLITCLMAWGLVCGVCGKRPDVYGASDCCNKGSGSRCLLCGIGVIFALGGVMALVLVAYFTVGVASQRFLCDPLTEPRDNRLFSDVSVFVDLERELFKTRADPPLNLTAAVLACHANHTLYVGLHLHRLFNIEQYRAEISRTVAARVASLRPSIPRAEPILRASARDKLAQLAASGLSDFDFDKILDALETNITSMPLDKLAEQLENTARALPPGKLDNERAALLQSSRDLTALYAGTLQPMLRDTAELNITGTKLRDEMRFNRSSLKEAITDLIHEATEADAFLTTQGPARLTNMTRGFATVIETRLNEYLDRVELAAREHVGRCGPLSNAFNATRDAVCNKILMPTNGYWMSMAWCVLLFVPLLVVAQRLARLYLHLDPYPGPRVEAEYLYDAYADRDNVPLANAYKAEKRGGRPRAREPDHGAPRALPASGGPAGGAAARDSAEVHPPPLDAHHARRYNDMAPKHWEEGPPRYHGPTEYERPPPYYYPGPNDRQ